MSESQLPLDATSTGAPESSPPHLGPQVPQLAGQLTEHVVDGVAWLRSRTTVPVVRGLRAVVYGLVIIAALTVAAVLVLIGVVRIWDVYLPLQPVGRRVWLGYAVVGGALFLVGAALLARRTRRAKP